MADTIKAVALREKIKERRKKESSHSSHGNGDIIREVLRSTIYYLPLIYLMTYIVGYMSYFGYAQEFNIDISEFTIPTDYTIYWGVTTILSNGVSYLFAIPILVVFYIFLISLAITNNGPLKRVSLKISFFLLRTNHKTITTSYQKKRERIPNNVAGALTSFLKLCIVLIMALTPIVIGALAFKQGISEAQTIKKRFLLGETPANSIFEAPNLNGSPYMKVACNSIYCAFWNKDGTLLLQHEQVQKMLLRPNTKYKYPPHTNHLSRASTGETTL